MIGVVASIPVLTASSPMSVATASICAATVSGGSVCTPVTPREFCTVTAVTATQPCTPHAARVRRSAATPAPPPESVPAIVMTRGGVIADRPLTHRILRSDRPDGSRVSGPSPPMLECRHGIER